MRYYYKDPLAAAWMAKHFGMRFQRGDQCVIGWHGFIWTSPGTWDAPFYIHPPSLYLLEPMVGDGLDVGGLLCRVIPDGKLQHHANSVCISDLRHYDSFKIIQRHSLPFHCPESEE